MLDKLAGFVKKPLGMIRLDNEVIFKNIFFALSTHYT